MSPLDVLADELGAVAGKIERDLTRQLELFVSKVEARLAQIELSSIKAEQARDAMVAARLAELRDGKDADIEPLREEVEQIKARTAEHVGLLNQELTEKVNARLAEVKDGEPGKDADMEPLVKGFLDLEAELTNKVEERLASLKDGEPGEPGRDADMEPVFERLVSLEEELTSRVDERLANLKDGADGRDGADGTLPICRNWEQRIYSAGEAAVYKGATYQAIRETDDEPPARDWIMIAARGADGKGFKVRQTYNADQLYQQNDVVALNGSSFVALKDAAGPCPGEDWQLIASKGSKGKPGEAIKGEKGSSGSSLVGGKVDKDKMVLTLLDSDGDEIPIDLYPLAEALIDNAP